MSKPTPVSRVLFDFTLVAAGGAESYARGFLAALATLPRARGLLVLLPRGETLAEQERALVAAGATVRRCGAAEPGTFLAGAARQFVVAWQSWRSRAEVVFVPRDVVPLLVRGRLVLLAHNLKVWRAGPEPRRTARVRGVLRRVLGPLGLVRAWRVLVVSEAMRSALPLRREEAIVVHHGCDLPLITAAPLPDEPETLRVTALATVSPHKRLDVVIHAVAHLQRSGLPCRLSIWGATADLREEQRLDELARELLGYRPLMGALSNERRAEIYGNTDVLVLGSGFESFGMTMVEAMRTATLLVAPDEPLVAEICGDAAITYRGTGEAAADALLQALPHRAELLRRGLERSRRFTWERCAADTLAAMEISP